MIDPSPGRIPIDSLRPQAELHRDIRLVPSQVQLVLRVAASMGGPEHVAARQMPAIHTLSQWVAELAARIDLLSGRSTPVAPGRYRIRRLWYEAVRGSLPDAGVRELAALARQAREADRLLRQWGPEAGPDTGTAADRKFLAWRDSVQAAGRRFAWCSPEEWISRLTQQVREDPRSRELLPNRIRLAGFVEFSALESRLQNALEEAGVRVLVEKPVSVPCRSAALLSFNSVEQEISAAARWAGRRAAEGGKRVGVIINGLESMAGPVRRIFENRLQAEAVFGLADTARAPFRISRGEPLSEQPLVRDALLLLRLANAGPQARHRFPVISRLLLSRNWAGGAAESFPRAHLERALRASGYYRWSLARIADVAAEMSSSGSLQSLVQCIGGLRPGDDSIHPARQLLAWLAGWGWPGDALCNGNARDVQASFLELLERLHLQSFESAADCLAHLVQICGEEPSPGPGGAFSPIQVITPEEAYGLQFEAAWVANMSMENWPAKPAGNPLLHGSLLGRVPRADYAGALDYAKRLTDALRQCSAELRFSWCDRVDDLPVSVSPLIADLPHGESREITRCTLRESLAPEAVGIRSYADHPWLTAAEDGRGRLLAPGEDRRLHGAVDFLEFQSACPLAAYLVHRLDAKMDAMPVPFADQAFRGRLMHKALERLYRPCVGSERQPDAGEVEAAVAETLARAHAGKRLLPAELNALRAALQELLRRWLNHADGWPPGRICWLEKHARLKYGELEFSIRIDRANRLDDGSLLLLDYKSGRPLAGTPWADERPGALQLPLYAVLLSREEPGVTGVANAHLRFDQMAVDGLTGNEGCAFKGVSGFSKPGRQARAFASWDAALKAWETRIAGLLDEIWRGDCRWQMFRPETLEHAGLDILLRREEATRWLQERRR